VLSQAFNVVKTEENENNEIGAPLTLLKTNADTDITLVEMGMRKEGDLKFLAKTIRPTHVILTGIGSSHIAFFSSPKDLAKAKCSIFQPVLSWEKERTVFMSTGHEFYSLAAKVSQKNGYKVHPYSGQTKPDETIELCYLVGRYFGLSDEMIEKGIVSFQPSAHRLNKFKIGSVTVVDDTYNANPDGVAYALQFIRQFPGRKIVVLGDMLELGEKSAQYHAQLGPCIIDAGASILFTYGDLSSVIKPSGMPCYHFNNKEALFSLLKDELKANDLVLIKGSRGLKMEWLVDQLKQHLD